MVQHLLFIAILFLFAQHAISADTSLEIGDAVPAFYVRDVTGPSQGKSLCYRCQYGARPVVASL